MVSLDEVSLFTKVLTDEALVVVQDKLVVDLFLGECTWDPINNLMEILTVCVQITYSMGPSRSCWNGTTSALQPEEFTLKGTIVSYVYYQ